VTRILLIGRRSTTPILRVLSLVRITCLQRKLWSGRSNASQRSTASPQLVTSHFTHLGLRIGKTALMRLLISDLGQTLNGARFQCHVGRNAGRALF